MGDVFAKAGKYDEAEVWLRRALVLDPRDAVGQVSVLAIEPHPANCARLSDWVSLNQLAADIEVVPRAIGDWEGIGRLRVNGSSMGHSLTKSSGS